MKKAITLVTLSLVFLLTTAFTGPVPQPNKGIMVYGLVYNTICTSSETVVAWKHVLTNDQNLKATRQEMERTLKEAHPQAKRIQVIDSRFSYGPGASNMAIISWEGGTSKCPTNVISVKFGKTEQEALDRAIAIKNSYAGKDKSYQILIQKYW